MKKTLMAVAFACTASGAVAGGLSDPIVSPVVIATEAEASSGPSAGLVLALTTLVVFGTALAN